MDHFIYILINIILIIKEGLPYLRCFVQHRPKLNCVCVPGRQQTRKSRFSSAVFISSVGLSLTELWTEVWARSLHGVNNCVIRGILFTVSASLPFSRLVYFWSQHSKTLFMAHNDSNWFWKRSFRENSFSDNFSKMEQKLFECKSCFCPPCLQQLPEGNAETQFFLHSNV